jgi:hypothetical protein
VASSVTSQAVSECTEKRRLIEIYETATREFSRTLTVLTRRMGVLLRQEYDAISAASERARHRSEEARVELEKHTAEHNC